jgi:hypothetical protein
LRERLIVLLDGIPNTSMVSVKRHLLLSGEDGPLGLFFERGKV